MTQLVDRRHRVLATLPSLEETVRGSIVVRQLRCGRAGCRCARGHRHEATYLSVTLRGGRTEQISLPAALVPLARRWVANYHALWNGLEKISALNRRILRRQRAQQAGRSRLAKRRGSHRRMR